MYSYSLSDLIHLQSVWPQATTWTTARLFSIEPLETNLSEIQNTKLFIHENAFENVICEMVAILSRGRWVKKWLKNKKLID